MAIIAKEDEGTRFPPNPEGIHHAICYAIYDLGTQFNETFGKWQRKIVIMWELPNSRIDIEDSEGNSKSMPRGHIELYTLSLHEKATLRKHLESWRGKAFTADELKGFDILKLLGVNCQLQIIHKTKGDKTYANVSSILPLQSGMDKKDPENAVKSYSIDETTLPEDTPEWIEKMVISSREKNEPEEDDPTMNGRFPDSDVYEDDIPF